MSKINQYQAFSAFVEHNSVTGAAAQLNLSVPAISKQLTQLEKRLGVQLFERSHKKLNLTHLGQHFYPQCKAILQQIDHIEEALISEQENLTGQLNISISKSLNHSWVMKSLLRFAHTYPDVQLNLHFDDRLNDLYSEDIDFAFRLGPLIDSTQLIAKPLACAKLVACATPEYIEKHQPLRVFSDLGKAKLILTSPINPKGQLKQFLSSHGFDFNAHVSHTHNDIEATMQMTKASLGIGIMLDISVIKLINQGLLYPVFTGYSWPTKALHLLSKKCQFDTKKHRVFKEFVNQAIQSRID